MPNHGLAPFGAATSAGTVMTKFKSFICTRLVIKISLPSSYKSSLPFIIIVIIICHHHHYYLHHLLSPSLFSLFIITIIIFIIIFCHHHHDHYFHFYYHLHNLSSLSSSSLSSSSSSSSSWHPELSSYPGNSQKPHWLSMGLQKYPG